MFPQEIKKHTGISYSSIKKNVETTFEFKKISGLKTPQKKPATKEHRVHLAGKLR